MRRDALLRRALIPKGYRPTRAANIDQLLDAIEADPIGDEKLQRMLRKINGQEPLFPEVEIAPVGDQAELTEQERELVSLYRNQNKPLPSDLAAKVKAMEERTGKGPSDEEPPRA